jgi:hypothetical protein
MPEATDEILARVRDTEYRRIEGPTYTADSVYLGGVGLSDLHPTFHAGGFSGELSPDSRFLLKSLSGDPTAVFVIFRQFDSSRYHASPEDHVAGWVPADHASDAQNWVDRMNAKIIAFGVTDD